MSDRVRRDCRLSRSKSFGVRGSRESTLERVEEVALEGREEMGEMGLGDGRDAPFSRYEGGSWMARVGAGGFLDLNPIADANELNLETLTWELGVESFSWSYFWRRSFELGDLDSDHHVLTGSAGDRAGIWIRSSLQHVQ